MERLANWLWVVPPMRADALRRRALRGFCSLVMAFHTAFRNRQHTPQRATMPGGGPRRAGMPSCRTRRFPVGSSSLKPAGHEPMHILLTNDDSHDSPLFLLAIRILQDLGDLTVVVPAQEQSWKGKSMTRFGELYVDRIDLHGTPAWNVSGTPADCVNLAIYNLMERKPDIVVSGINIGINTGLGFFMASGTLGACFEANIARIPAIALSQALSREDHRTWNRERTFSPEALARMSAATEALLPKIWREYGQGLRDPVTWSFNIPDHCQSLDIVRTRLGRTFYGRCFSQRGDQYYHDLDRFEIDAAPDTDQAVVFAGQVSATLIDLSEIGQHPHGPRGTQP